ncbi:predicted metal-dependent hydrolase of metallo-beta-lactamase superfamily [Firmicutes bacterium CAG:552]|nr:MAG: ribonuclease J [Firmicutes bacterium CAG:552_39_19]CDB24951.1 predicted metal-dependent hydrolase of metallo-beta-lactamase superfamily [Firmicutes bacterium CAG:552]
MKTNNQRLALRVIFLGGVGEIGKNMTALELGEDIMIIDCGSTFPGGDMPGVDLVIPDANYLIENRDKVRGIVLTHGHEDHIGGLPYILKDLKVPVYGTQLTIAILEAKLREAKVQANLNVVKPGGVVSLGKSFKVEFVNVSHSIAGSCALSINTPLGLIFHTGDFKVDFTPVKGNIIDLNRIAELGNEGVLLLMCESTNIERAGFSLSESAVGKSINAILQDNTESRVFITTFASNVHRLQQLVDLAEKYKRKVVFAGRSMLNIVDVALSIGEFRINKDIMVDVDDINKYADKELMIITTGSQGEPMSALSRIANDEFGKIQLHYNDLVIISASPIPGNERMVYNVINNLYRHGAKVIYESLAEVHASGHACREEIKLMHSLLKPKFFIPVHGEHRHLKKHADLAISMGMRPSNIIITDIGDVVEVSDRTFRCTERVRSGALLVDGLGVGEVGSLVLRDRKHLAQEGSVSTAVAIDMKSGEILGVDITSRGFAYTQDTDELLNQCKELVKNVLLGTDIKAQEDWNAVKQNIRKEVKNFIFRKTKRSPMIIIQILEV